MFFPTLDFMTEEQTEAAHIEKLREWVLFHSFVLDFPHLAYMFEDGRLRKHRNNKRKLQKPVKKGLDAKQGDDIGRQVYFFNPQPPMISYKALFEQFQSFTDQQRNLLKAYLLALDRHPAPVNYSLFNDSKTYWQITSYASILEAIIGHASNCSGSIIVCPVCNTTISTCTVCNKKLPSHRKGSEEKHREEYLTPLIPDKAIRDEYLDVINTAFYEIRHPTAHAGAMPMPEYILPDMGATEVYNTNRARTEFRIDRSALYSLLISVRFITRYLVLHELFQLNSFPRLEPLKVFRFGGAVPEQ